MNDIHCPPSSAVTPPAREVLAIAAQLNSAVNDYRAAMDTRAGFRETVASANAMARYAEALVSALVDAAS